MDLDYSEPKVQNWIQSLESNGCSIKNLTPLSMQYTSSGELLFAYVHAEVISPEGYLLMPIAFLRGHAVVVVPLVRNILTGEERYVMVEQRRIANGAVNLEFPAGMLDRQVENPGLVALKELFEETGLVIQEQELFPLTDRLYYSTPGACDEGIWFYGAIVDLEDDAFLDLDGRIRMNENENERIRVVLKTVESCLRETVSLQGLLGHFLMNAYRETSLA